MNTREVKYISFLNSSVGYYRIGSGSRLVFAIHGYGESGSYYSYLSDSAHTENATIFALDLPFHGKTVWNEDITVTAAHLNKIFESILKNENIDISQVYEIWGYSMGGRIALGYFQSFPRSVKRIVLVAPDGIYVNPWYQLATGTSLGNRIFKYTMQHPTWFMTLLKVGYRLKLINKSIFKFATNYVDDPQVRNDLYIRWTAFRKIHISHRKLVHLIHHQQVPVKGIYGEFDRIIPYSKAKNFWQQISSQKKIVILNDGHKLLQSKYACYLWKD